MATIDYRLQFMVAIARGVPSKIHLPRAKLYSTLAL